MTRTYFNLTAVLVLLVLALPVWAAPQGSTEAQIVAVKGKASLVHGQAAPVLLHKHDTIQAGDEILTDRKSSATVRLPDGSTFRIYPNSHVVLRTETGDWKEFLHVFLGNVRVQIEKLSGRPNPKALTTPTAIIAVRGTVFAVAVEQTGDTQVGVAEGLVSVASLAQPKEEVLVKPGQSCWVRHGQLPTQPEVMKQSMPGLMDSGMSGNMGIPGGMGMPGTTGTMGSTTRPPGAPTGSMGGMGPRK